MANNEPKVRTRTRTRKDGVTIVKTKTKTNLSDGGRSKEKRVEAFGPSGQQRYYKTKGRTVYGQSTKEALGVTTPGKVKVTYKNKSMGTSGLYGEGGTVDVSSTKAKRILAGEKKRKQSSSTYMSNVPSETYTTRSGKNIITPAYVEELTNKFKKVKKSKGKGVKKVYESFETGGYNEYGKKMKDIKSIRPQSKKR